MSKVFETNALKGKSLASGMKKRLPELAKYGVKEADLTAMEQDADKRPSRTSRTMASSC